MPQASDELRAKMQARFGEDACTEVFRYLEDRGWTLAKDGSFEWIKPSPDYAPTDDEWDVLDYLYEEWDYGGLRGGGA